ncbi:MAG: LysR family transcriptional regulator ArgP [Burkholderiales bacterium]
MKTDPDQLRALLAVVREGSFLAAARVLHLTPSAVSQRVRALEERCGAVVVARGAPCVPTEVGRLLCRHAERLERLELELAGRLRGAGGDPARPTLRIAVNADSLGTWFMRALATFAADGAALVDVVLEDQDHSAEALRRGEVLAAVTSRASPVQGCRSLPLGKLRYLATASPAFVARHFPRGIGAASLAQAPSLRFNRKDALQDRWIRRVAGRAVDTPHHWLPSTVSFVEAARLGIGWGMNPEPLVRPLIAAGELVELVPGRPLDTPLHWQHPRLSTDTLDRLTQAVAAAAKTLR